MHSAEHTTLLIQQAQHCIDGGKVEQALQICLNGLLQNDHDVDLWNFTSNIYRMTNQPDKAHHAMQRSAELLFQSGDIDAAVVVYRKIVNQFPQDAQAQLALATIYRQQGQVSRAALAYELASQALAAVGLVADSLAAGQRILEMSPDNVGRRIRLAEQYAGADMKSDAVREYSIAAGTLRRQGRYEDAARILDRLRQLGPAVAHSAEPTADAAVLIAEAESFLRLGLIDKAVDHLAAALVKNPFLRSLREPLVRLYVAQGRRQEAVAELWELLTQCADPSREVRYLRYILRLDPRDQTARRQLSKWMESRLAAAQAESQDGDRPDEGTTGLAVALPPAGVADVEQQLRSALGQRRPATDLATTSVVQLPDAALLGATEGRAAPSGQALRPDAAQEDLESHAGVAGADHAAQTGEDDQATSPSGTTRPGKAQVEAIAEEIALSSQSFRRQLAEIDRCIQEASFDDALGRLQLLSSCYPLNRTVQALVAEIEQVRQSRRDADLSDEDESRPASDLPVSNEIGAAMRALTDAPPSQSTPTLSSLTDLATHRQTDATSGPQTIAPVPRAPTHAAPRVTQQLELADVTDVTDAGASVQRRDIPAVPGRAAPQTTPVPPPPPRPLRPHARTARTADALAQATALRARGEVAQALAALDKLGLDDVYGAQVALLTGLCLRDQGRLPEAIAVLLRGVNMPAASESDLSELFYALGESQALAHDPKEAILFFQLSQGATGSFRDAQTHIDALQRVLRAAS